MQCSYERKLSLKLTEACVDLIWRPLNIYRFHGGTNNYLQNSKLKHLLKMAQEKKILYLSRCQPVYSRPLLIGAVLFTLNPLKSVYILQKARALFENTRILAQTFEQSSHFLSNTDRGILLHKYAREKGLSDQGNIAIFDRKSCGFFCCRQRRAST